MAPTPRIVLTTHGPQQEELEEPTWKTFGRYAEAVRRAGGEPVLIDPTADPAARARTFAGMDGLLLPGGADLAPALFGQEPLATTQVEPGRDELEADAWSAASERGLPILGVCRGMQAINIFAGGSLVQHVEGHDTPAWPSPEARPHSMRIRRTSRLAAILGLDASASAVPVLEVNSYHHQAIRTDQLGTGLAISGTTDDGELVEVFEAADPDQWLFGVQSHPERQEFTPPAFARLWRAFVAAAAEVR